MLQCYSPSSFQAYFGNRPLDILSRCFEIAFRAGGWIIDFSAHGADEGQQPRLARDLREVLTSLGPSFVKLGQVLSSRVDLLPDAYIRELRTLTDQVEPFPFEVACQILEEEWASRSAPIAPRECPRVPTAAASLGQVYRVQVPSGGVLAVKVQRPGVREQICRDLFILRSFAPWAKEYLRLNTDLVAFVDEYGKRFVAELDYNLEADNAEEFQALAERIELASVCAPTPVRSLTTQKVLVSEWVEGERIDADRSPEGARLCGVALTAYLTMLLETGNLHADPHPGNLLRKPDGCLCILDWGLTTRVEPSQQDAIISYFTHILAEDYDAVPQDLVKLGFIADGSGQALKDSRVARAISAVFKGLASGGSARKRVQDIIPEVQEVRRRYGNIGQLPPYFTYILRAFSVLEGIGLDQDPSYAIVSDCYPYLVSRLLREDGARAQQVLEGLLYGPTQGSDVARPAINSARFVRLVNAVATYSTQASKPANTGPPQDEDEAASAADPMSSEQDGTQAARSGEAPQLLRLLQQLSRSSALQDVVVQELARTTDVLSREALDAVTPPILRGLAPPRTEEDEAVLGSWQSIARDLLGEAGAPKTNNLAQQVQGAVEQLIVAGPPGADAMVRELLGARSQVAAASLRFVAGLLERAAVRAASGTPVRRRPAAQREGGRAQGPSRRAGDAGEEDGTT